MIDQSLIRIRHCREADVPLLQKVAEADNHTVLAPTFIMEKGEQLVGYLGLVPSVLVWLDTERVKGRDSLQVMNFYENWLSVNGHQIIAVPCVEKSPLRQFLPRLQYVDAGDTKLFLKNLTQ
jgi:ketopantoate hydroxymethyltransferase